MSLLRAPLPAGLPVQPPAKPSRGAPVPSSAAAPGDSPLKVFDEPAEWSHFSQGSGSDQPAEQGTWTSQVRVEGMHCAACALTVEQALCRMPGVLSATVSSASQRARVVWSAAQTRPSQWLAAAQLQGYRLVPDLDHAVLADSRRQSRLVLWLVESDRPHTPMALSGTPED